MPRVPCGASGSRARTRWTILSARSCSPKVMKIFWPRDPVAAVAGRLGAGLERADVGAGLRLGQVHRPGPFAGDQLRQPGLPAARPSRDACSASTAAGVSIITSEKPILAEPRSSITTLASAQRQPLPAMFGAARPASPSRPRHRRDRPRGSRAAWSRPRATICAPTSSPIRFSGANSPAANAPAPSTIASTRSGEPRRSIVAGELVDADDMAEQEFLFLDGRRVGHVGAPRRCAAGTAGYSAAR